MEKVRTSSSGVKRKENPTVPKSKAKLQQKSTSRGHVATSGVSSIPVVSTPIQGQSANTTPIPSGGAPRQPTASKNTKKSSTETSGSRPCREHSFLTDVADVRQMEQGLMQLLDDFHSGKLQAFGQDCSFEKMDQVREQQETLARLHFELDSHQEMKGLETPESQDESKKNLSKLMDNLQELCISIQNLQKTDQGTSGAT